MNDIINFVKLSDMGYDMIGKVFNVLLKKDKDFRDIDIQRLCKLVFIACELLILIQILFNALNIQCILIFKFCWIRSQFLLFFYFRQNVGCRILKSRSIYHIYLNLGCI